MGKRRLLADAAFSNIRAVLPKKSTRVADIERVNEVNLTSAVRYVLRMGIKSFDERIGGFPFGRMTELFGLEGCGKSSMGIRAAVKAATKEIWQIVRKDGVETFKPVPKSKMDVMVMHFDQEQAVDEVRCDVDGVSYHSQPIHNCRVDAIEDMFKIIERAIMTVEEFQARAKKENDDTLYFSVIVVDTIAATSSLDELAQAWDKKDYDRRAGVIHEGLRRLVRRVNRANVCLLCVNQVHSKITNFSPYTGAGANTLDNVYTSPGGMGLRFYSWHRVFMHRLQVKYRLDHKRRYPDGELIAFWAVKNRIRPPQRAGYMALLFGGKDGAGGGFNDCYSDLETLVRSDYAEISASGHEITFKFNKHGIPLTTFDDKDLSLSEADEDDVKPGQKKKDPKLKGRLYWPKFYEDHKVDMDALINACLENCLTATIREDGPMADEDAGDDGDEQLPDDPDDGNPRRRRRPTRRQRDESVADDRLDVGKVSTAEEDD